MLALRVSASPWAPNPLWRTAQIAGIAVTVGLLIGLVSRPELSLLILWTILIPLVPASAAVLRETRKEL